MDQVNSVILKKLDLIHPIYNKPSVQMKVCQLEEETRDIWNSIKSYIEIIAFNLTDLLEDSTLAGAVSSIVDATVMLSSMTDIMFQLKAKTNSHHRLSSKMRMRKLHQSYSSSSVGKAATLAIDLTETKIKQGVQVIQYHAQIIQSNSHNKAELTTAQEVIIHHLNRLADSLVAYHSISSSLSNTAASGTQVKLEDSATSFPLSAPLPTNSTPAFYNTGEIKKPKIEQYKNFYKKRYSRSAQCLLEAPKDFKDTVNKDCTQALTLFDSPKLQRNTAIEFDCTSGDSTQKFNIKSINSRPTLSASTFFSPRSSTSTIGNSEQQPYIKDKETISPKRKRLFSLSSNSNKGYNHQQQKEFSTSSSSFTSNELKSLLSQKKKDLMDMMTAATISHNHKTSRIREKMPFLTMTTKEQLPATVIEAHSPTFHNYPLSVYFSSSTASVQSTMDPFSTSSKHDDPTNYATPANDHGVFLSSSQHTRQSSTDNDIEKIEITDDNSDLPNNSSNNKKLKPLLYVNDQKLSPSLPTIESFLSMLTQNNNNADDISSSVSGDESDASFCESLSKAFDMENVNAKDIIHNNTYRQDSNSPPPPPVPPKDHVFYFLQQPYVTAPPLQSTTNCTLNPQAQHQQTLGLRKPRSSAVVEGTHTTSSVYLNGTDLHESTYRRYPSNRNRSNTYFTPTTTTTTTATRSKSTSGGSDYIGDSNTFYATIHHPNIASASRPPIPPRRSSMPTPVPKSLTGAGEQTRPSLPSNAKDKVASLANRNRKNSEPTTSVDSNPWPSLEKIVQTDQLKKDGNSRPKLGKSLGTLTSSISSDLLSKKKDSQDNGTRLLRVMDQGKIVLLYEMIGSQNKLQVIAGTSEKLFEKLADETTQDVEYLETYITHFKNFTTPKDLLKRLINRFRLRPLPGEYEHFRKWKLPIQAKVLNIINLWVTMQYDDFYMNEELRADLVQFLLNEYNSVPKPLKEQINKLQQTLEQNAAAYKDRRRLQASLFYQILRQERQQSPVSNMNSSKLTLPTINHHFNFQLPFVHNHITAADDTHMMLPLPFIKLSTEIESFLSTDSKDIAKYLTLADYYLFKCILYSNELLQKQGSKIKHIPTFTDIMTKRANMISHWVVHEILKVNCTKAKKQLLKKFIEIAKLCLDYNNFHTCMVIILGLSSTAKLKDTMSMLANKDTATFNSLSKLLSVDMNMRHYRKKIRLSSLSPNSTLSSATIDAVTAAAATSASSISTTSTDTIKVPFLPVVLKDQTFFNENTNHHQHQQLTTTTHLVNFSKYSSIQQFIHRLKLSVSANYSFSYALSIYPFMPFNDSARTNRSSGGVTSSSQPSQQLQLNSIAAYIERCINQVQECYMQCDLLTTVQ